MPLQFDPEYHKAIEPLLPMMEAAPKPAIHDVQARREGLKAIPVFLERLPDCPDVEVTTHQIDALDGSKLRLYTFVKKKSSTANPDPGPAVLHIHGGGMIACSVETFARNVTMMADRSGVPFFSVEYRLAPESQGPALVEDCYAALLWLHQNAEKLNIDPKRIAVMGESAGGGLAAGVALMARDKNLQPPLAKQILIYPMLDDRNTSPQPDIEPFTLWQNPDNITGWTALLGDKAGKPDADVSYYCAPARAESLAGLPPTYMDVGELDIFKQEDMTYARRLMDERISTEFHLYPGLPHAFEVLAPDGSFSHRANQNRIRALTTF